MPVPERERLTTAIANALRAAERADAALHEALHYAAISRNLIERATISLELLADDDDPDEARRES